MGANVTGYALPPDTNPSLFKTLALNNDLTRIHLADIRDIEALHQA